MESINQSINPLKIGHPNADIKYIMHAIHQSINPLEIGDPTADTKYIMLVNNQ